LRREIFEERNLLLGKWPDFGTVGYDLAEQLVLYAQWHEERSANAAQFGCEDRKLIASICDIGDVNEPCSAEQLPTDRIFRPAVTLPHPFREALRQSTGCNGTKGLAVVKLQCALSYCTKRMRLFQYRVKYRREIAGRGVDDLQ